LSPRLKAEILRKLQRLELVIGMIKTIEAERDAIASGKIETEHSSAKRIQDLTKIKCIGPEFATTLVGAAALLTIANNWRATSV
jgi:transposase